MPGKITCQQCWAGMCTARCEGVLRRGTGPTGPVLAPMPIASSAQTRHRDVLHHAGFLKMRADCYQLEPMLDAPSEPAGGEVPERAASAHRPKLQSRHMPTAPAAWTYQRAFLHHAKVRSKRADSSDLQLIPTAHLSWLAVGCPERWLALTGTNSSPAPMPAAFAAQAVHRAFLHHARVNTRSADSSDLEPTPTAHLSWLVVGCPAHPTTRSVASPPALDCQCLDRHRTLQAGVARPTPPCAWAGGGQPPLCSRCAPLPPPCALQ